MGTLPTYGMAGIGIAAAIGFVFALTILSSNPAVNPELTEQQSQPSLRMEDSDSGQSAKMQAEDPGQSTLMMQQDAGLQPMLTSIIVRDAQTGQVIGEVMPEMQFEMHRPVFIQANFVSEDAAGDYLITLAIAGDENNSTEMSQSFAQAASFRGGIAAGENIELELYWNPDTAGEYTLLLFSGPESASEPATPIKVPIKAV